MGICAGSLRASERLSGLLFQTALEFAIEVLTALTAAEDWRDQGGAGTQVFSRFQLSSK